MPLQALRRWIARHPLTWVLGLALVLAGAQFAAAAHEFSHVAPATSASGDLHANATHDCPTCLLAAALGGAAPASASVALAAGPGTAPAEVIPAPGVVARVTPAYAPRAPPALVPATSAA